MVGLKIIFLMEISFTLPVISTTPSVHKSTLNTTLNTVIYNTATGLLSVNIWINGMPTKPQFEKTATYEYTLVTFLSLLFIRMSLQRANIKSRAINDINPASPKFFKRTPLSTALIIAKSSSENTQNAFKTSAGWHT